MPVWRYDAASRCKLIHTSRSLKKSRSYHFTDRTSFARSFFSTGGTKFNIHEAHLSCDGLGKYRERRGIRTLEECEKEKNPLGSPCKTTEVCITDTKCRLEIANVQDSTHSMTKSQHSENTLSYTNCIASKAWIAINERKMCPYSRIQAFPISISQ